MEAMSGYDRAILIDAVEMGGCPAGTIHNFSREDLRALRNISGIHDTNLAMALQIGDRLELDLPKDIRIWGVEIEDGINFGEELTPGVAAAVPVVVKEVLGALQG
jgi:hydrogenase maturation protease